MGRSSESTGGTPNLSRPGTFGAGGFATNNPRMLVMVFDVFAWHLQYLTRASLQARSKKRTTPSTRTGPSALFSPGPIPWSRGLRSCTGTPTAARWCLDPVCAAGHLETAWGHAGANGEWAHIYLCKQAVVQRQPAWRKTCVQRPLHVKAFTYRTNALGCKSIFSIAWKYGGGYNPAFFGKRMWEL